MVFNVSQLLNFAKSKTFGQAYKIAQEKGFAELPGAAANFPYLDARLDESPVLGADSPQVFLGREVLVSDMEIGGFKLPVPPIVRIEAVKTVVKTPVQGRKFTYKEIISTEDYKITIQGFVLGDTSGDPDLQGGYQAKLSTSGYPLEILRKMNELFLRDEALPVICRLFTVFEIDGIVIERFAPILEGFHNAFAYEIEGVSDTSFELVLDE